MRHRFSAVVILFSICGSAIPQSPESSDLLLARARAVYDAPFTRNLASFDCAVRFDWTQHFTETFGTLPSAAKQMAQELQTISHRISVDHRQGIVSSIPKQPNFSGTQHEAQLQQLEQVFNSMVSSGLNAWLPMSTNGILPVGKTQYEFEKMPSGYKLTMNGENGAGTLLLQPDLRVTSGVMQLPQPMRFSTDFESGPEGFVLSSVKTDTTANGEATFAYTYQSVDEIQLPDLITVTPATTGKWQYRLTDCKVVKFVKVKVLPPN